MGVLNQVHGRQLTVDRARADCELSTVDCRLRIAATSRFTRTLSALIGLSMLAVAACAPQAPAPAAPAPTAAPPKAAPTAIPKQAEAPAPKPAATTAPAAKPTEKPAARPTEKPAAKPAFDEKAVADFYKGKTVRIVIGYGPGGPFDINARLLQSVLARYVPGNPTVIVENKPGAGSMLAANTVFNSEPKDGTVIAAFSSALVLQQAIGAKGVQFDARQFNWLGTVASTFSICAARTDSGINSIQDVIGGKELSVSSFGKGTPSYDPPAAMNAALGTKFKIVMGYESGAAQVLAVKNKEVQGFCSNFDTAVTGTARDLFEASNTVARILVVTASETPKHPLLDGVPSAEKLARTDESRAIIKAVQLPNEINFPYAIAPEVPKDRVEALRKAVQDTFADQQFRAGAEKAGQSLSPKTGAEVTAIVQQMLSMPAATLAKLGEILQ